MASVDAVVRRALASEAAALTALALRSKERIESDPNAEPFYRAMGARRVGVVESKIVPGRSLPILELDV